MPRLDNADPEVARALQEKHDVDTGQLSRDGVPLDICAHHALALSSSYGLSADVEHPPYSDDIYTCVICGSRLDEGDN